VAGSGEKPARRGVDYRGKVCFVVDALRHVVGETIVRYCDPFQPVDVFAVVTSRGVVSPWNFKLLCYVAVEFDLASR
jgi:hypothetical protein